VARGIRTRLPAQASWSLGSRLAIMPLVVGVLLLGVRGNLEHRGLNLASAALCDDHLANELSLASSYSLAHALYRPPHERSATALCGAGARRGAIARVRRQPLLRDRAFTDTELPLLHREEPRVGRPRPFNLVVVLEESLGAEFVGSLGGQPLTPRFDALSDTG